MFHPLLEARHISKRFPGVQALDDVSLHVSPGEILAVCGENGAGKSTLMKIVAGVYTHDAGEILLDGQPVRIDSVHKAESHGIVLIHQELNLAEHLDVAANIFLGREPTWGGPLRLIDKRIYRDAEFIIRRIGLECSPRDLVSDLPVGQQQLVEIARALSQKSRLLILDEPTSSLTERETARLFEVIFDLKKTGISILYISHRLREIETVADRVVVLRDGKNSGELPKTAIRHDAIVRLMVGRELKQFYQRHRPQHAEASNIFEVSDIRWSPDQKQGINFTLRPGEIVGMAGLMGAGRTELAETLFGVRDRLTGNIQVQGVSKNFRKPADAIAEGIFLVPEDRRHQGLILAESVRNNISLASLGLLNRGGWIKSGAENRLAESMTQKLNVRTPSIQQLVGLLSGGNQQKVVLAKWLARTPRVLILDEPTRGVDVGAKSEIYALMDELANQGLAILMISSDLEEILGMSDRVLVLHEGRLAGAVGRENLTEEAIMRLATGASGAA